ncbi:D-alanyl-D-alanine carboxypeptidase/D-alanyl-D-alanine endopeptidase [Shewanella surugensis]|uniref:D-alanyl-D-alanine carboxypeptidase/D-alanyl-D-alanine-endopeptidase n=1 Tax=Shewanella surugensis TaxID=212020 RepID=A0ABT0LA88_9GAMM|nr:D-alanyl-D-alanine carboxypeptidase/D-alanyl-D-alanine-endopeptidase [Shewanella surugensis]MCL1124270.1 D-alanyl-D-alanine carboxypeptidase/D-alanyl-D-alanine-endopeptidase [Shewanella surugensis]
MIQYRTFFNRSASIAFFSVAISLSTYASEPLAAQIAKIEPFDSLTAVLIQDISPSNRTNPPPILYQRNAHKRFLPASTMKLLTAVATSSYLGPKFTFKTRIYSDAPIVKGIIEGDLFIAFSGDPSFTKQDLFILLQKLKTQGLNKITGNLYLLGANEETLHAPGWAWEDLTMCYASPISQYAINQNCIKATLLPSPTTASSGLTFNENEPISITTAATFSPQNKDCELNLISLPNNQFHITGCFSNPKGVKLQIAVSDPLIYAKQTLKQLMSSLAIQLNGQLINKQQDMNKLSLLVTHQSKPLSQLLNTLLLKSDNFIADSLIKKMGQNTQGKNALKQGIVILREELNSLGIDLTHATIVDGSGLSRYNLLSASQLASILHLISTDSRFKYLLDSLPISGVKGTLSHRYGFDKKPIKQHVIAKTGTLKGVNNLAGFIKTDTGKLLLFVSLENGISEPLPSEKPIAFNLALATLLVKQ